MFLTLALVAVTGYLIGSVPNGLLIGRMRGMDIRQHGSGNIGATNALRVLGKKWGLFVFALDFLKGFLAARLGMAIAAETGALTPALGGIIAAVASILGHNFPVWLRFKGGKGIATSGGVLIGLLPLTSLILMVIWNAVFFTTRYVSLASIAVSIALPITVWILIEAGWEDDWANFWFALILGVLAVWRHRSNIQRLMAGTEPRFERKR